MRRIKIFDISRAIGRETVIYPGNPRVRLARLKRLPRDGQTLSTLAMGLHTATHMDAPSHMVRGGRSVETIPLHACMGWARVVNERRANPSTKLWAGREEGITERDVRRIKPKAGEIILFKTKNSDPKRAKKFHKDFAHLAEDAARALVKAKVKAVGIDGPSIKKFRLRPDAVHPLLLKAGIPIYEGLDLRGVTPGRYFFIGLPLKITGGEASPVRAVLIR